MAFLTSKDLLNPIGWNAPEYAYAIYKAEKENKEVQNKEVIKTIEQAKKQFIEKYGKDSFDFYSDPAAIVLYDFLALKSKDNSTVKSSSSSSNSAFIASSVASKTLNERKSS